MNIGQTVYVYVRGYEGVYRYLGKIGDRLRLCKVNNPLFTLVVSADKVIW